MKKNKRKNRIKQLEAQNMDYRKDITILLSEGRLLEKEIVRSKYRIIDEAEAIRWRGCGSNVGGLPNGLFSIIQQTPINELT